MLSIPAANTKGKAFSEDFSRALFPEHMEDLQKSGITRETAQKARLYSVNAKALEALIGWIPEQVETALVFPYLSESDGFCRVKVFPSYVDNQGKTVKYLQRPKSGCRIYIPPGSESYLSNPSLPILGVEGEKKSLKVAQGGILCYALGGLWNWLNDGKPIPGFDGFAFADRLMPFAPDSDVWKGERFDLLCAVFAYCTMLESRGATVPVVIIPPGPRGEKWGADDFLVSKNLNEFQNLKRLSLKHRTFDQARQWWKGWSQKGQSHGDAGVPVAELIQQMQSERLLHPAQDYADGVLYFGVPVGDKLFLVTCERKAIASQDIPKGLRVDNRGFDRCDFSQQGIQAYLAGEMEVTTPAILKALEAYFKRFAVYPKAALPLLLAIWTLGTYLYRVFEYYAYLVLRSPQKRCGKSRVEDLLSLVAFNASNRETRPTEASIFRGPSKNAGTLILDEIEMLGNKDQDTYGGLLAVLNAGFQRGGDVTRMEKHGEKFVDVKYPTYAPRVLAGIKKLAETLEDRSITIIMQRKRKDQKTERFSPRRLKAETQGMKDRCYVWALTYAADVAPIYEDGDFPELSALDDRAKDLWEPLMTIAYLADQEAINAGNPADYVERLKALAEKLCEVREEGEDDTEKLIRALIGITQEQGRTDFTPTELLPLL